MITLTDIHLTFPDGDGDSQLISTHRIDRKPLATAASSSYCELTPMLFLAVVLISLAAVAAMYVVARRRRRIDLGGVSDRWLMSPGMEL